MASQSHDRAENEVVAALARYRDQLREEAASELADARASLSDDIERLRRAKAVVCGAGLDRALLVVLKEVWHYPAWSKRDDFAAHSVPGVSGIVGGPEGSPDVSLAFRGLPMRITLRHELSGESTDYATLSLRCNDATVLSLAVTHDRLRDGECYNWHMQEVKTLQLGSWSTVILEFEHAANLKWQRYVQDGTAERIRALAHGLPALDEPAFPPE